MKRLLAALTLATLTCTLGPVSGTAAARADSDSAALVAKVLADMPVIDGHNDLPWEIRERFASNVDAVDLKQNTALLQRGANAPAIGIKFDVPIEQSINWWGLIKAGFESIEMRGPLRDPTLKLVGKPWRVLQFGSRRIPVIRKKNDDR